MCNKCGRKVGNGYAESTMSRYRPLVDAVAKVGQTLSFALDIYAAPLETDADAGIVLSLLKQCPDANVLAFEALNNGWPDDVQALRLLKETAPNVTILRIVNGNGSLQFWDIDEVLTHLECEALAA